MTQYICYVRLLKEDEGFSAISLNLPGCVSQGDTQAEALENIREAFEGLIESYLEDGQEIPFNDYVPDKHDWKVTIELAASGD